MLLMSVKLKRNAINNHTITPLFSCLPGRGSLLIISHRDIDGLISAFLLAKALQHEYRTIDILFSQPYLSASLRKFLTSQCRSSKYRHFALLDISIDYIKPASTKHLFSVLEPKLRFLIDHHTGWDTFISKFGIDNFNVHINHEYHTYDPKYLKTVILGDEPCCANLVYEFFNLERVKDCYLDDLLRIALISDDLTLRKEAEGTELYDALVNLKNQNIHACMSSIIESRSISDFKSNRTNWYKKYSALSEKIIRDAEEVYPGIGYVKCFPEQDIGHTYLCEVAYKKYKILVVKELDARRMRISYTIAHAIPGLDLTKLFRLCGGNPRRITICKRGLTINHIITKLKPFLEDKEVIDPTAKAGGL